MLVLSNSTDIRNIDIYAIERVIIVAMLVTSVVCVSKLAK